MKYTKEQIEKTIKDKGYLWFNDGDYNLNIIGVRNSSTGKKVTNVFDDYLYVVFKVKGEWLCIDYPITTDPGTKSVLKWDTMGIKGGVARLVEGQYRGTYRMGLHRGKPGLQQIKPVKVFRDINKDLIYDETKITEGLYGINIHRAGKYSTYVNDWSAGCQVFKNNTDYEKFWGILKNASEIWGKTFTYTLISSDNIK
jgi:hypothetical protein